MLRKPIKRKQGKKAQIRQIVFIIVTLFSLALTLLIGKIILSKFNTALVEGDMHTAESEDVMNKWQIVWPTFDYMIVFILVGLTIGLLVTSWLIPTHPIFIVVNIFGIFFLIWLGALMSDMYGEMIQNQEEFADIISDGSFSRMNFIMNKLPWIACILIFLSTIIMYSKGRQEISS